MVVNSTQHPAHLASKSFDVLGTLHTLPQRILICLVYSAHLEQPLASTPCFTCIDVLI